MANIGTITVEINLGRKMEDFLAACKLAESLEESEPDNPVIREMCKLLASVADDCVRSEDV